MPQSRWTLIVSCAIGRVGLLDIRKYENNNEEIPSLPSREQVQETPVERSAPCACWRSRLLPTFGDGAIGTRSTREGANSCR
jgi:hypothetical protein